MNITEEKVFQIAEKLADEVFGKEGMEKYSERQVLTVELNKILTSEINDLGIHIEPNEHDVVVVIKANRLVSIGDEGTIVHIHRNREDTENVAYEVEFVEKDNLLMTLYPKDIRKKM